MTSVIEYWKAQTRELARLYNEKEREVEQVVRHFADQSEELKSKQAIIDGLEFEIEDLQTQSTKLRELVEALLQCAGETKRDKGCDACPMWTEIYEDDYLRYSSCMLGPTLKELGIEWK